MYTVAGILFLLPCSMLLLAWRTAFAGVEGSPCPAWREYSLKAAVLVATVAVLTNMTFFASWFYNGGSPHGLDPHPGLWSHLGRLHGRSVVASVVVAALGRGKGRLLVIGSALADIFVSVMVFALDMD
jgi:hypothetical protein